MPRTLYASLSLFWATSMSPTYAQDIIPRSNIESNNGISYLDTSNLSEGTSFYQASSLSVQLLEEDPIFTLHNTFVMDTHFYGESDDYLASLSLLRYTPTTTKMTTDVVQSVLTGIFHDRRRHLFYEIRQDSNQMQMVRVTAEEDIPPTADPPPFTWWQRLTPFSTSTPLMKTLSNRIGNYFGAPREATFVDVMVLWTQSTECYHSNLATGCSLSDSTRANMEAVVTLMIAETNTALVNSATGGLIRLVHMERDSSGYVETDMVNTLNQITSGTDCVMDYIHGLRNDKKADLVQFIVDNRLDAAKIGGIAWLPRTDIIGCWDSSAGYSVICAQCTVNYISAHELGHNLGCQHDRGTENMCTCCTLDCHNRYGYRSPSGTFRTIMAYECASGQCDNNPGNPCPRIPYYSGEAEYKGESLGGASHNCRKEIERMKGNVANYRT